MFKSGRTFQIVNRTYQVKRRQRKRNKIGGEKTMGEKIGRKEIKKKGRKKVKSTKQKE